MIRKTTIKKITWIPSKGRMFIDGDPVGDNGVMLQEGLTPGMTIIDTCFVCGKGYVQTVRTDGSVVLGDDCCDDCHIEMCEMLGVNG
jgi:hypothetical protein